jgi:hypothetical protein
VDGYREAIDRSLQTSLYSGLTHTATSPTRSRLNKVVSSGLAYRERTTVDSMSDGSFGRRKRSNTAETLWHLSESSAGMSEQDLIMRPIDGGFGIPNGTDTSRDAIEVLFELVAILDCFSRHLFDRKLDELICRGSSRFVCL